MDFVYQVLIAIVALVVFSAAIYWFSRRRSHVKIETFDDTTGKAIVSSDREELETAKGPTLVLIFAHWCGHCKTFGSQWLELKSKMGSSALAFDEGTDYGKEVMNRYGVSSFPTILLLPKGGATQKDEEIVFRGNRTVPELQKFFASGGKGSQ